MNIYDNGFLKLDYEASTDILLVVMPPVNNILLPEISRSFGVIVENVTNYDIKRLLIDARETKVEIEEAAITPLLTDFAQKLSMTRIQKVARLVSSSFVRELVVQKVFQEGKVPIEFETFTEEAPAVDWLTR